MMMLTTADDAAAATQNLILQDWNSSSLCWERRGFKKVEVAMILMVSTTATAETQSNLKLSNLKLR